jgi:hypothetical protein
LAIIGSVLSVIVFVTTLAGPPDTLSLWPPLVQAAARATGAFLTVWLFIPLIAYAAYLVLARLRKDFPRIGGPGT